MVRTQADADEVLNRASSVVSTIVRAHQRAAGARRTGPGRRSGDCAISRSRGGLTTKIYCAADGNRRPFVFVLTAGHAGDEPTGTDAMAVPSLLRRHGRSRTRSGSGFAGDAGQQATRIRP